MIHKKYIKNNKSEHPHKNLSMTRETENSVYMVTPVDEPYRVKTSKNMVRYGHAVRLPQGAFT